MDEPVQRVQKRARVEREEWAKRVERWRDSGLRTAEFATELGINPRTLRERLDSAVFLCAAIPRYTA